MFYFVMTLGATSKSHIVYMFVCARYAKSLHDPILFPDEMLAISLILCYREAIREKGSQMETFISTCRRIAQLKSSIL